MLRPGDGRDRGRRALSSSRILGQQLRPTRNLGVVKPQVMAEAPGFEPGMGGYPKSL